MSPKWRVKNKRTRKNTSKKIKGGKHTLRNITEGILSLASHLTLEKEIHWDKSETFGDKMAGNRFKKFGWYLKSSIHGHPREKKFEGVNITVLKCCSHVNLKLRFGFNYQGTGTFTLNSDRSGPYCTQFWAWNLNRLSFGICCLNLE